MSKGVASIKLTGEESARFTRLAVLSKEAGVKLEADIVGREPLTSRIVRIRGTVIDARLDGYLRYIVVEDKGAVNVKYWVGGSNSTRSIGAQVITYNISRKDLEQCIVLAEKQGVLLPGISQVSNLSVSKTSEAFAIDSAISAADEKSLEVLLKYVSSDISDSLIKREAALGLRSFADLASTRISIQRRVEDSILDSFLVTEDRETRIALVENLGYFGTSRSLDILSSLAVDDTDSHVRWASVVAIGRLPDPVELVLFIDAFEAATGEEGVNWPRAAALLSISRRLETIDRTLIEPFLCSVLAMGDDVVSRYACLALSRFSKVGEPALDELLRLLGNDKAQASTRGYAALAISGLLRSIESSRLTEIENLVESLCAQNILGVQEPEDIWATEFLAELASLLELEGVSIQLNRVLSSVYTDWRADYYDALASYSSAEIEVRKGNYSRASNSFLAAIRRLENICSSIGTDDVVSMATTTFRLDLTKARYRLHQLLRTWADSTGTPSDHLLVEAKEVAAIYRTYSVREVDVTGSKHLNSRELNYVISTRRLVDFLKLLILLDTVSRKRTEVVGTDLELIVGQAVEYVNDLEVRFRDSLARGLEHLVEKLGVQIGNLEKAFRAQVSAESKLQVVRSVVGEIRIAFSCANWPMPARACPVNGLGRGEVQVISEGLIGDGSKDSPLKFPCDSSAVLNVAIKINEMAPGGATRIVLVLKIGTFEHEQMIHAVEGSTTASIPIDASLLPTRQWLQGELSLVIHARDCEQTAYQMNVYLKKESDG